MGAQHWQARLAMSQVATVYRDYRPPSATLRIKILTMQKSRALPPYLTMCSETTMTLPMRNLRADGAQTAQSIALHIHTQAGNVDEYCEECTMIAPNIYAAMLACYYTRCQIVVNVLVGCWGHTWTYPARRITLVPSSRQST